MTKYTHYQTQLCDHESKFSEIFSPYLTPFLIEEHTWSCQIKSFKISKHNTQLPNVW
jgi:hypothetical protein